MQRTLRTMAMARRYQLHNAGLLTVQKPLNQSRRANHCCTSADVCTLLVHSLAWRQLFHHHHCLRVLAEPEALPVLRMTLQHCSKHADATAPKQLKSSAAAPPHRRQARPPAQARLPAVKGRARHAFSRRKRPARRRARWRPARLRSRPAAAAAARRGGRRRRR